MKILSKKDVSKWCVKTECDSCESSLEVDADDLYIFNNPDPRESGIDFQARCVVCNNQFWVARDKIPGYVQNYVQRKRSSGIVPR